MRTAGTGRGARKAPPKQRRGPPPEVNGKHEPGERLLPHNREAERALLGCMLRENGVIPKLMKLVRAEDFYAFGHQKIFEGIAALAGAGLAVNFITLSDWLQEAGQLEEAGGHAYVVDLWDAAPGSAGNAGQYATIVARDAHKRSLIRLGQDMERRALEPGDDPAEIGNQTQRLLGEIAATLPSTLGQQERYRFAPISAAELDTGNYSPQFLIRNVLVDGQPAVIGGPHKALKTSKGLDMAVSLASGTPYLGRFDVAAAKTVCFVSGESGRGTIQETARRICHARGFSPSDIGDRLHFDFRLPQLANIDDRRELQRGILALRCQVVFLDPLYLSLFGINQQSQSSDVFSMGPLLLNVAQACLDVGCTPILMHHFKTTGREKFGVPSLDDLSHAGIKEFARQWILLSRREEYQPGSGVHRLWLSIGGSIGHGGLWALDADEGLFDDGTMSREKWDVSVSNPGDARIASAMAAETQRSRKKLDQERAEDAEFLNALDQLDRDGRGVTQNRLTTERLTTWNSAKLKKVTTRLQEGGFIESLPVTFTKGNGTPGKATGFRRVPGSAD